MDNLIVKHGKIKIALRAPGPMSHALTEAYTVAIRDAYGVEEDRRLPAFLSIFVLLIPHTRSIEGVDWQVPETSDMALMPGGITLTKEEIAQQVAAWARFTDDNLELYDKWVKAVDSFYRPKDVDLAPEPLPDDADPKD